MRAAFLVAPIAFTVAAAAGQTDPIDAMLADRLAATPDAGIVLATIDSSATKLVTRGRTPAGASIDGDTVFEIGGLGEVFTAVALADMAAKGEVQLADPVAKHLPGLVIPTSGGKSITLEHLVLHRSGLPRRLPGTSRRDAGRFPAYSREQLAAFLADYEPTGDIGAAHVRSDIGLALLAVALEMRAGKAFDRLLHERVFAPLGLEATHVTAGGIRSTASDVVKFVAANLNSDGPLASVLSETQSSRGLTGARGESLGLGWRIRRSGARQILWSSGGAAGHQVFIGFEPAAGRGAVVMQNLLLSVDDLGFRAIEELRESAAPVDLTALAAFAGEYEIKPRSRINIRLEGRKLAVQIGAEPASTLTQDSELRFVFDDSEARITFVRDAAGSIIGLMLHRGGQHVAARKVR